MTSNDRFMTVPALGQMRLLAAGLACLLLATSASAHAYGKKGGTAVDKNWKSAPSVHYAGLSKTACHAELRKRAVSFESVAEARGVLAPVRIPNGIDGVLYRTALSRKKGRTSPWEVFDCRLVVALVDFTKIIKKHDIDEVRIFSGWRPPRKSWPLDKIAKRHPGALAIDIRRFRKKPAKEGEEPTWLNVEDDWKRRHRPHHLRPQSQRAEPSQRCRQGAAHDRVQSRRAAHLHHDSDAAL